MCQWWKGCFDIFTKPAILKIKEEVQATWANEILWRRQQLPMHIILGAADYQRLGPAELLVLGENRDTNPGTEYAMLNQT